MYATEIKWMEMFLDKVRTPWLNPVFVVCDHLDSVWLVLILAAVIYHLFNRKEGLNFLFILVVSGVCNHLLKELFALPAPQAMASPVEPGRPQQSLQDLPSSAALTKWARL